MLCSVAVSGDMLPTVPDLHRKKGRKKNRHGKKQPNTLHSLPGQLAWRERHSRSTYCDCGKPLLLDCCWNIYTCWFVSFYIWSQNVHSSTPSYLAVSGGLAGGVQEKRDLLGCFYHPPWQLLRWRLGWKDCCCCWLWLDLLAISRMLCSVTKSMQFKTYFEQ